MANIAEQIVDMLVKAGVKRIYAVTGDSLNKINDAVRKDGRIQWIHVRHEETGAFCCRAEAQLHGNLACCAGSGGPGHVHLINGLYDAHRSGAPVLAIASTIISGEFGTTYFQETDTIRLFDDCSYYNQLATTQVNSPHATGGYTNRSLPQRSQCHRYPGDLTGESQVNIPSSEINYPTHPRTCPSDTELQALADLLNNNSNITLFCGIGAKDAHEEIVELSHRLKAPVAYSFKSKMEINMIIPMK